MTRKADRSTRTEAALLHLEQAVSQIAAALDPDVQGSLAARLLAEAKGARASAEAASAGVQALAAITGRHGEGTGDTAGCRLADVLAEVRSLRVLMTPTAPMPAPAPGSAGTAGPAPETPGRGTPERAPGSGM